jgi:hypothetical protein
VLRDGNFINDVSILVPSYNYFSTPAFRIYYGLRCSRSAP